MATSATEDHALTSLSICIVTFKPDWSDLARTLRSLQIAISNSELRATRLVVVDNSPIDEVSAWLKTTFPDIRVKVIAGHGNIGFGRANNLAIADSCDYHLVLNPDVEMDAGALEAALSFMRQNPECGLLSPAGYSVDGSQQYLCKRYPTLFDLLLRGFAPLSIRKMFQERLNHYEMRDKIGSSVVWDPPLVSGCFMLFRGNIIRALSGFDPGFMLYFEDFDISIRASEITRIAHVPDVKIIHSGGYAAKKGYWHILQFIRSALYFYSIHKIVLF